MQSPAILRLGNAGFALSSNARGTRVNVTHTICKRTGGTLVELIYSEDRCCDDLKLPTPLPARKRSSSDSPMASSGSSNSLLISLLVEIINYPYKFPTAFIFFALYILYIKYGRWDLRSIPGPFLASVSNLYRFYDQWSQHSIRNLIELHEKHGTFVRYGPNLVSIGDPEGIAEVYGVGKGYAKVRTLQLPLHEVALLTSAWHPV
jgi:hypothetical protein